MTAFSGFPPMHALAAAAQSTRLRLPPLGPTVERSELIGIASALGVAGLLVLAGLIVHFLFTFAVRRIVRYTRGAESEALLRPIRRPLRAIFVALALLWTDDVSLRGPATAALVVDTVHLVMPLLWGWLAIALVRVAHRYVEAETDLAAEDNLEARRRRTRADILARIAIIVLAVIAVGLMLLQIPAVKEVGMALVASAGLAGLAVGVAAQPLLKNIVSGMQLAFTEPMRIDDVVVYQGEWARVESISLTYVVLKIWDDRRLVVPVSKLVEEPIENWTRKTSHLLGTVMLYVDHAADIERMREAALAAVRGHRLWDGRVAVLQVTDMSPEALTVRVLMSGRNGSELFDLRCDVREAMIKFLRAELPGSLNRSRVAIEERDDT